MSEQLVNRDWRMVSSASGDAAEEYRRHQHTPRILYIIGWGRSGSTLLGNALAELAGSVHLGESHDLWSAYARSFECGCGVPLPQCAFWRQVSNADKAVGMALTSAAEVHETRRQQVRVRYVPRMLRDLESGNACDPSLQAYADLTTRLYRAVSTVASANIVVDSTKSPGGGALLLRMPCEVSFIHLVRDPRATGYSWRRHKWSDPGGARRMVRLGYGRNAASWLYWNLSAELIRRHVSTDHWIRVRYEDFATAPERTLRHIAESFKLSTAVWPLSGDLLRLRTHHTVEGNPGRFETGIRRVHLDDQWSQRMPYLARAVSVALTLPLFIAYGYSLGRAKPQLSTLHDGNVCDV